LCQEDSAKGLLQKNKKKLALSLNFTFRYTEVVLSLNNFNLGDFADRIYPIELEIKDTTDTATASYLEIYSEDWLRTNDHGYVPSIVIIIQSFPHL
jgi:hypothetical protein